MKNVTIANKCFPEINVISYYVLNHHFSDKQYVFKSNFYMEIPPIVNIHVI